MLLFRFVLQPGAKPQSMFSLLYASVAIPSANVKKKNVFQVLIGPVLYLAVYFP